MSLSSSLFSGISGLNTLGNAMTVIGDNIANVNTVGFKASRATFQDVLSQSVATSSGSSQVGRGTSLADITANYAQGSFESTDSSTDLAIGGTGFFMVRDANNEEDTYYTRAGQFGFDEEGNFINPSGYRVQGWALDETTGEDVGTIRDIQLNSFTSAPSQTNALSVIVNLDADGQNHASGSNIALSSMWDGSDANGQYIQDADYEYQNTLKVYDSLGSTHDITLYFDLGESATDPVWEYIVTCNPSEDHRTITDNTQRGLLARGILEFGGSSGTISGTATSMTCAHSNGDGTWTDLTNADAQASGGYFSFSPAFIGGSAMNINLNFGAQYNGSVWANEGLSTTQFSSASTTVFQSADGYGSGDLQSITVDQNGVLTGQYSNGQVLPLFRVGLAKFQNEQGLYKAGGNLLKETRMSGEPITGRPGYAGLGDLSSNSLEQSNVDLATEFVRMITTQRGYQANSKIITVTDQMLSELMNLKR